MWVSKRKWQILEKKVADLEVRVQSQQEVLKTCLAPPMDSTFGWGGDTSWNRGCMSSNAVGDGGGGINYNRLTIEALRDINVSISDIGSFIKNINIPL